jgi:hypothetical protein
MQLAPILGYQGRTLGRDCNGAGSIRSGGGSIGVVLGSRTHQCAKRSRAGMLHLREARAGGLDRRDECAREPLRFATARAAGCGAG